MKYQCDFYGCKERCPNRAVMAYDDGEELHLACEDHKWVMRFRKWKTSWEVVDDSLEENAQNRTETNERAVGVQDLRETAKRLIADRDERLKDRLIMHALGVRWG